jgi:hypothetical protein
MNRAVSGVLITRSAGRPLAGHPVVAAAVDGTSIRVLGIATSADLGRFRICYPPLRSPVDLTLFIFSPHGHFLFREPLHRAVMGAELMLRVEVPIKEAGEGAT